MRPTPRRPRPSAVLRDAASAVIESLESRRLLSTTFADGVVQLTTTNGRDLIDVYIYYEPVGDGTDVSVLRLQVNGHVEMFRGVTGVGVDARGGADAVDVRSRNVPAGMEPVSTTLLGGDGNDTLVGSLTSDLVVGGAGDDDLYDGGGGRDSLFGGAGSDFLCDGHRDQRNVYLCSGAGNDIVSGPNDRPVYDHLESGDGRDTNDDPAGLIALQRGLNFFRADGTLFITGGDSDDDIRFLIDGDFYLTHGLHHIRILTGGGNDRIQIFARGLPAGIDVEIDAGDGDDTILTASGDDTIISGAGHDVIDAGGGANVTDRSADDVLWNSGGAAHLDAAGNVVIDGTSFDDEIVAYKPEDAQTYEFWVNNTRYTFARADATGMIVNAGDGDDYVSTDPPFDLPFDLSATLYGGAGADTILGGIGADSIDGGDGDDYLWDHKTAGRAGILIGGPGDDTLGPSAQQIGGPGENLIFRDNYPWTTAYFAIPGTDGTGSVETDTLTWAVPDEYNPAALEEWVLDPLLPQDVDLVDDGAYGFWRTDLCSISPFLPPDTDTPAAPASGSVQAWDGPSVGPFAGEEPAATADESPAPAAAPADTDASVSNVAYAPPPSMTDFESLQTPPSPWADDPTTDVWDAPL